ncbi:unnamed protein product [Linum trigynum]|uniref:Uncharacterized protein n=1 Tax=Linum trigynum TaxID=586398 RepID=A0AAV2E232_9ROSI
MLIASPPVATCNILTQQQAASCSHPADQIKMSLTSSTATPTAAEANQQLVAADSGGDGIQPQSSCAPIVGQLCPEDDGLLGGSECNDGASAGVIIGPGGGGGARNSAAGSGVATGVEGSLVIGPR